MSTAKGTISSNDLMQKLVQAKKVMNKVETGQFEKGNVNENLIKMSPEEIMSSQQPIQQNVVNHQPSLDRISKSKLPDAIKKAMIENPIPKISLNDTIDMDIVKGAKKLMEREGMITKKTNTNKVTVGQTTTSSELVEQLIPLIENVVRKVMDEKLTQILTAHQTQTMNENLVLKVGDSVFKGKITGVNKSK